MIKVKVKPEDFIVEEIADVSMCSTGNFCVYLLKKRGWNTVDVLKNLTENDLRTALDGIENVKKDGYPNYFDDQRFGSFDARQGFVAEKIIKKHYNGALKIYFSCIHPEDSKDEKEHRKFIYENCRERNNPRHPVN